VAHDGGVLHQPLHIGLVEGGHLLGVELANAARKPSRLFRMVSQLRPD
jgi:hypothetical protein